MPSVLASQGTRRFTAFCITLGVLTGLAALAFGIASALTPELVLGATSPIVALATGYLGFGNWHDKSVRTAIAAASSAEATAPGASS